MAFYVSWTYSSSHPSTNACFMLGILQVIAGHCIDHSMPVCVYHGCLRLVMLAIDWLLSTLKMIGSPGRDPSLDL